MSEKEDYGKAWEGDDKPYAASYGKLMMWFFLITDTLTFSAFLAAYGFSRFKYPEVWPVPEDVFTHFPFLHGNHPLLFVALMTFILIMSSVTMVLAVNYGHKMQKNKVVLWLSLTIVGGCLFLGSQAWEWGHFIHGDKGGVATKTEFVVHIAEGEKLSSVYKLMDIDKYSNDHILKYSGLKDLKYYIIIFSKSVAVTDSIFSIFSLEFFQESNPPLKYPITLSNPTLDSLVIASFSCPFSHIRIIF